MFIFFKSYRKHMFFVKNYVFIREPSQINVFLQKIAKTHIFARKQGWRRGEGGGGCGKGVGKQGRRSTANLPGWMLGQAWKRASPRVRGRRGR